MEISDVPLSAGLLSRNILKLPVRSGLSSDSLDSERRSGWQGGQRPCTQLRMISCGSRQLAIAARRPCERNQCGLTDNIALDRDATRDCRLNSAKLFASHMG